MLRMRENLSAVEGPFQMLSHVRKVIQSMVLSSETARAHGCRSGTGKQRRTRLPVGDVTAGESAPSMFLIDKHRIDLKKC